MDDEHRNLDTGIISDILKKGNTAEVKKTKNGIIILEVSRKIRYKDTDTGETADSSISDNEDKPN